MAVPVGIETEADWMLIDTAKLVELCGGFPDGPGLAISSLDWLSTVLGSPKELVEPLWITSVASSVALAVPVVGK